MTAFDATRAVRLPERDYFDFACASIEAARRRVWVSMFIYDIRPSRDIAGRVSELTLALATRQRLGIDVRVLLTGHVATPDIAVANLASGLMLRAYGIAHRRVFADATRNGSHAKFVIIDDEAILGSQNWTDDAFRLNIEDAVVLSGKAADLLGIEFLRLWELGRGLPTHATQ